MLKNINFEKLAEFDNHRLISFFYDKESGLKAFIAIHRGGIKYPALGATRIWRYKSDREAVKDVLKLSKIMSYKSALAGLKYGGAKGVIITPRSLKNKSELLRAYAQKLNYLNGHFITGTDVGLSLEDLKLMKKESKFFIGFKAKPEKFTAIGVFESIKVCLIEKFKKDSLTDKSFAIQGLGKVGYNLLNLIYNNLPNSKIFISDINLNLINLAKKRFPKIIVVSPEEIYKQKVDVFCPCALGGVINYKTLPYLNCKIIVGGANNQLQNDEIGEILYKNNILYAPDYVVNAGGLISVVDEYQNNNFNEQRVLAKVLTIKDRLKKIINKSKKNKIAPNIIANQIAQRIFNKAI